jgi:hypothetical protein
LTGEIPPRRLARRQPDRGPLRGGLAGGEAVGGCGGRGSPVNEKFRPAGHAPGMRIRAMAPGGVATGVKLGRPRVSLGAVAPLLPFRRRADR